MDVGDRGHAGAWHDGASSHGGVSDEETAHLLPLPVRRYEIVVWKQATVHADCHVHFDKRLDCAPWRLINQGVWVRATSTSNAIYVDDVRVPWGSWRPWPWRLRRGVASAVGFPGVFARRGAPGRSLSARRFAASSRSLRST